MKTHLFTFAFAIVLPAMCVGQTVQSTLPPGKLIFSNGKDAIAFKLGEMKEENLTNFRDRTAIAGPFAASKNGRCLIFTDGKKIYKTDIQQEPTFKSAPKKIGAVSVSAMSMGASDQFLSGKVTTLELSENGERLAYDGDGYGYASILGEFVPVPPNCCRGVNMVYTNRITSVSPTVLNKLYNQRPGNKGRKDTAGFNLTLMFGNIDPVRMYRYPAELDAAVGGYRSMWYSRPLYKPGPGYGLSFTWDQFEQRFSERHDAGFPKFSDGSQADEQLLAIIYKSKEGYGPIDLYNPNAGRLNDTGKPGLYTLEFKTKLERCEGLGWAQGDLFVLSAGNVGLIEREKIDALVGQSTTEIDTTSIDQANARAGLPAVIGSYNRGTINKVSLNNAMTVEPTLVVQDARIASNLCPVSRSSFFCLDDSRNAWFYGNGQWQKVLTLPAKGYPVIIYCPTERQEPIAAATDTFKIVESEPILLDNTRGPKYPSFHYHSRSRMTSDSSEPDMTTLSLPVQGHYTARDKNAVTLTIGGNDGLKGQKVSFGTPSESLLTEVVKDPTKYLPENEYQEAVLPLTVTLQFGQVLLIKAGGQYVGMKPRQFVQFLESSPWIAVDYYSVWRSNPELDEQRRKERLAELAKKTNQK